MKNLKPKHTKRSRFSVPRQAWELLGKAIAEADSPELYQAYTKLRENHKPAPKKYLADFKSHINGIPCGILVTSDIPAYLPAYGSRAAWENPPEPAEFNFLVLRASGAENTWLANQLTQEDELRIEQEWREICKEKANDF